jgi:hypothetical protein
MHLTKVFIDVQYSIPRDGVVHRDGNRYKPTGFSLLRPIPMKEPPPPLPHQVTHLVSWKEISQQTQTRQVK